jgi:hypothetical protein
MFIAKWEEVTAKWRKLHKFNNLFFSCTIKLSKAGLMMA